MHFAILSSCSERWGGSEELWFEAACALRDDGHRVDVFKARVDEGQPRISMLRSRGCRVRDLYRPGPPALWYAANSPYIAPVAVRLQLLAAGPHLRFPRRPDLAIVSQGGNYDGANLARLCEMLGIPYVLVSQKASPLHWPSDSIRRYVRGVHERARRSVFVSQHNLWLTKQQLDTDVPNAVVVDNPVLAGREGPLPWPAQDGDGLRLACIGRMWVLEKGQDILLEVLAQPRWRDRKLSVSVFGDGQNREGLQDMARRLGLDHVSFHGHVSDIEDVWRTHHGLVLTSRAEGLPLVVLEAMACGRVPIVTDVGGSAEVIDDGETGFVATGPSVDAVDDALERAWTRRAEWQQIGAHAALRLGDMRRERGASPLAAVALDQLGRRLRTGASRAPQGVGAGMSAPGAPR